MANEVIDDGSVVRGFVRSPTFVAVTRPIFQSNKTTRPPVEFDKGRLIIIKLKNMHVRNTNGFECYYSGLEQS